MRPDPTRAWADMRAAVQYSLWLDQHGPEEVAKYVRTALEACAPAARAQPGFDDVYPLMLRLCAPGQK